MTKKSLQKQIERKHAGAVLFRQDFPEYHTEYVGATLSDMAETGTLLRLAQGIYYKPIRTELGISYPFAEDVVAAVCKRDRARYLPTGASAANRLGLSEQVPTRHVYLTNGTARQLTIGNQTILLKHVSPSHFAFRNETLSVLLQAMKWIGKGNFTEQQQLHIEELVNSIDNPKVLQHDLALFPVWARTIIKNALHHENVV